jgi:hypothetical protein
MSCVSRPSKSPTQSINRFIYLFVPFSVHILIQILSENDILEQTSAGNAKKAPPNSNSDNERHEAKLSATMGDVEKGNMITPAAYKIRLPSNDNNGQGSNDNNSNNASRSV